MAGNVVEFTDANFQSEVISSDMPVLVDFWAPWCGPCRMLAPTIEALATEYVGRVRVGKMDTDNNPKIASDFGISSIPTVMLFKGGAMVSRWVGVTAKEKMAEAVNQHL